MVNLSKYYDRLMETKQKVQEIAEPIEISHEPLEQLVTEVHGFEIFVEDDLYWFMDGDTKYTSRDLMKLEDKALELKDAAEPKPVESDVYDPIVLDQIMVGRYKFESPWGNGLVKIDTTDGKEKIQVIHGPNVYFGEAKEGAYSGNVSRIKELIRINLDTPKVDEAATLRRWSNAAGLSTYEQIFGDNE